MKMKAKLNDGTVAELKGKKFFYEIEGSTVALFVHQSLNRPGVLSVSHFESGKKIIDIPTTVAAARRGDPVAAARVTMDRLVEQVGAERILTAIARG